MITDLDMSIFTEMKMISILVKRNSDFAVGRHTTGITGGQCHILGFLATAEKEGREVYQKDIEAEFGIRGSTVSRLIQSMEKNDLVHRETQARDGRLKRLRLTEKAKNITASIDRNLGEMAEKMLEGVTVEERQTLLNIFEKIRRNAQAMGGDIVE